MNDRQLARSRAFVLFPELGPGVQQGLLGEEKGVLGVPDLYLMLVPYPRSDAVDGDEPMAPKVRSPVVGPLLVDMPSPLMRDGGREQDRGRQPDQSLDEESGRAPGEMLCHFEAHGEVESPVQLHSFTEISLDESL